MSLLAQLQRCHPTIGRGTPIFSINSLRIFKSQKFCARPLLIKYNYSKTSMLIGKDFIRVIIFPIDWKSVQAGMRTKDLGFNCQCSSNLPNLEKYGGHTLFSHDLATIYIVLIHYIIYKNIKDKLLCVKCHYLSLFENVDK